MRELLERRIENIYPTKEDALNKLKSGMRLRIYLGIDPTGPNLHLGHTIPILFLKQLLELGHKPVLLIGDFTAKIGDPTGKETARKALTGKEVKDNMKNYLGQVYKILPRGSFEVKYNSSWLSKMSFEDVVELASHVTVQQMEKREMFKKRVGWKWKCPECKKISLSTIQFGSEDAYETAKMKVNITTCPQCQKTVPFEKKDIFSEPILLHEFLYPLMQGYDSVAMKIDGEVGGNDQTFNMLVGRKLEKKLLNKDKLVFATRLLVDAESGRKMSKTEGGLISLADSAQDIYGRTMKTVPDEMIMTVFELCTERDWSWIKDNKENIKNDPLKFKRELAFELTKMYHGEKEAQKARDEWEKVFSKGELPLEMEIISGAHHAMTSVIAGIVQGSNTEAKKLLDQGAIKVNNIVIKDWGHELKEGDIVQVGPKTFRKIK